MTEWNASDYHQESTLQQVMAQEQLATLTLQGNERILDVGCGEGKITAAIADKVPQGMVIGVDPSSDMIAFAAKHFSQPNLTFQVADARTLLFQNEFDLVVSFNALHWVPAQEQALNSIRSTMKPTGRAMLRLVSDGSRISLEDVIEEVRKLPRWANHFTGFVKPYIHIAPEAYRQLAEACGFRVERLNVFDKAWDFKTRESFVAFARATFVEWTRHLPPSDWLEFITAVLDRYQAAVATSSQDANTFKFYQMDVELVAVQ